MKKYTIEGVVTKVTENEYVLLCDDGTFRNIPLTEDDIPMLGERKTYTAKARNLSLRIASTVAMVAVLFIALLAYKGVQNHSKTNYIAAIDINPSLEVHLDEDLNVIKLLPLNTDGKEIVDSIESEGVNFYRVVDLILSQSVSKGYLTTDEKGSIETTIVKITKDTNPPLDRNLKEVIETQLQRKNIVANVQVFNGTEEFYDQSERAGISMNKYRHYQTLRGQGLVQDIEEVKEKSIKQLEDMENADENKVPVEADQGKGDSGQNAKSNPESRQNQSKSTLQPKEDQSEQKPAFDERQEPPDNEGRQQKDRKPSNKSSTPEKGVSQNKRSSKPPSTRDVNENSRNNEANQKVETENDKTNSNDNTKSKAKTENSQTNSNDNTKSKARTENNQTNSNDKTQPRSETGLENQPKSDANDVKKKDKSTSKDETGPQEESINSNQNQNGENENRPSSPSKPE
ncbi:anti-sigma-I factor RsgI family protein [Sediminibacillus halophilus]|uniref:Anti-sigma factor RsgI-like middle domain-containing protein n=1 Tax=Sediminibacillus halophilus TaxID=482461 RepID=A0A1G9R5M1_9BACI|nr:hypothetical protein [Sediminibacillus halophilus]SDM18513.1 hypothetical protein SAMN05216244_1831 [Sediminibacillus halophilus]